MLTIPMKIIGNCQMRWMHTLFTSHICIKLWHLLRSLLITTCVLPSVTFVTLSYLQISIH